MVFGDLKTVMTENKIMNKIYIITYVSEEDTDIMAYQSESQAQNDISLMKDMASRFDKLHSMLYDNGECVHPEEEQIQLDIDNFENTLSKEEFQLFQHLKGFEYLDGDFEIKTLEIKYVN
jgi:hypothetical protein